MAGGEKKKHLLHELLEDDQEPFHLNHYISDLRSQMGCSTLRVKKRKSENATVLPPGLFSCERSCFFATHNNSPPDPRKSPLFELRSPANKKSRDRGVFLHIPARTAAILLEAAARIQKQQSEKADKTNNRARNRGYAFGMLGSVLKRLTNRKAKPCLDNADGNAVLSERGSEQTSSSSRRERLVEIDDKCFCESPFHFVLHTTPSTSGHQTPHFTSTATSPARRSSEDEDSDETESLEKVREQEEEDKAEEDKEQCSPVSVLDPLEEEEDDEDHHQREPDHPNHHSCSFEVVQRAKRRLLKKLRRFEKLAGLDPVDLEGKMSGEEEEDEESEEDDNVRVYDSDEEYEDVNGSVEEERSKKNEERQKTWGMMNACRVGMGAEEDVDVVVQKDMRGEAGEWTKHSGEMEEAVSDLELSIFFFLIDELSHELVSSPV
ncbi:Uncharacterized protein Rs2_31509 [Raphanus sativus]|uniref:Uncharacterized protein LOC108806892 n=1 Tax=Raphanus sativus TaxID=3726 RepID=A0A6J0JG44_RAPSA|nr:uncharacterized protein LOC108806892 [Raphanus sativus]KAJ4891761.1 Uncharacterized protein Rs2_31509 [Raphanus sativus]